MNQGLPNPHHVRYARHPFSHVEGCSLPQAYKVPGPELEYEETNVGPTSIKHLYSNHPNWYPVQRKAIPKGTMYDTEYAHFDGMGRRLSYHFKVYPFTHRHAREVPQSRGFGIEYPSYILNQKSPHQTENSLNSPLQSYPFPYSE